MTNQTNKLKEKFDKEFPDLSNTEVWFWFEKIISSYQSLILGKIKKEREKIKNEVDEILVERLFFYRQTPIPEKGKAVDAINGIRRKILNKLK